LKRVEDAIEIRRKILTAFEQAEATGDADRRASLLTFLIVGGGPTGVELAGAIAELARFGMEKEFRMFDPADARVILVQSAPRLLPAFPETLAVIAQRSLEKLGVQVLLGSVALKRQRLVAGLDEILAQPPIGGIGRNQCRLHAVLLATLFVPDLVALDQDLGWHQCQAGFTERLGLAPKNIGTRSTQRRVHASLS